MSQKAKMTKEDRAYFKQGMKTLCGTELLQVNAFINSKEIKSRIDNADYEFMEKEIGRQAGAIWGKLLRSLKKERLQRSRKHIERGRRQ